MKYCNQLMYLLLAICLISCVGCKKEKTDVLIGKWVYKINLSDKMTGLTDVKETTLEFFDDHTFKIKDLPAVISGGNLWKDGKQGKGHVLTGTGYWKRDEKNKMSIDLDFREVEGFDGDPKYSDGSFFLNWDVFARQYTIIVSPDGDSTLCIFHKIGNSNPEKPKEQ